ncbi:hypothetical protein PR048_029597 [Dryococelus australis]|uniref:Aminopeptidase N-like N-terminal domain-containing protein n=1 Tax=Dryococelus australis TaxID=614101 RepID=A0ABQ9GDT9_9NEOP|nr:hypothetical protein PR048_029597 [Dryococelus australis]
MSGHGDWLCAASEIGLPHLYSMTPDSSDDLIPGYHCPHQRLTNTAATGRAEPGSDMSDGQGAVDEPPEEHRRSWRLKKCFICLLLAIVCIASAALALTSAHYFWPSLLGQTDKVSTSVPRCLARPTRSVLLALAARTDRQGQYFCPWLIGQTDKVSTSGPRCLARPTRSVLLSLVAWPDRQGQYFWPSLLGQTDKKNASCLYSAANSSSMFSRTRLSRNSSEHLLTSTIRTFPTNLKPKHYRITLKPFIYEARFEGHVAITVLCTELTSEVVLQVKNLDIAAASVGVSILVEKSHSSSTVATIAAAPSSNPSVRLNFTTTASEDESATHVTAIPVTTLLPAVSQGTVIPKISSEPQTTTASAPTTLNTARPVSDAQNISTTQHSTEKIPNKTTISAMLTPAIPKTPDLRQQVRNENATGKTYNNATKQRPINTSQDDGSGAQHPVNAAQVADNEIRHSEDSATHLPDNATQHGVDATKNSDNATRQIDNATKLFENSTQRPANETSKPSDATQSAESTVRNLDNATEHEGDPARRKRSVDWRKIEDAFLTKTWEEDVNLDNSVLVPLDVLQQKEDPAAGRYVIAVKPELEPGMYYTINISYSGAMGDAGTGFYRINYTDATDGTSSASTSRDKKTAVRAVPPASVEEFRVEVPDMIDVKHVYTEVDFAIGPQFIRHALDNSETIADLQGNKWIAAADLQPGHAQEVFPCFEEPNVTSTFEINVAVKENMSCLSNMPEIPRNHNGKKDKSEWQTCSFNSTPSIPTILVSVIVWNQDFKMVTVAGEKGSATLSFLARRKLWSQTGYGLSLTSKIQHFLCSFLQDSLSISKLDIAVLPGRATKTSGKWGLLVFRSETGLLTNSQCGGRAGHPPRRRRRGAIPRPSGCGSATQPLSYEGRATYNSHLENFRLRVVQSSPLDVTDLDFGFRTTLQLAAGTVKRSKMESDFLYSPRYSTKRETISKLVARELCFSWLTSRAPMNRGVDLWFRQLFGNYLAFLVADNNSPALCGGCGQLRVLLHASQSVNTVSVAMKVEPSYQIMDKFVVDVLHPLLQADTYPSAQPAIYNATAASHTNKLFNYSALWKGENLQRHKHSKESLHNYGLMIPGIVVLQDTLVEKQFCAWRINWFPPFFGTAVGERLDCSPPTKKNRVQYPAKYIPDFRKWESCLTMPLVGGFSQGYPLMMAYRKSTRCNIDDVWTAFDTELRKQNETTNGLPANMTIKQILDNWMGQTGYPILHVTRNNVTGSICIKQTIATAPMVVESRIWEPMRAKLVECGGTTECKGGGDGRSARKPSDERQSPGTIPTCEHPGVTPREIKPSSPTWDALC